MQIGDKVRTLCDIPDSMCDSGTLLTGAEGVLIALADKPTPYRDHADAEISIRGDEWQVNRLDLEVINDGNE